MLVACKGCTVQKVKCSYHKFYHVSMMIVFINIMVVHAYCDKNAGLVMPMSRAKIRQGQNNRGGFWSSGAPGVNPAHWEIGRGERASHHPHVLGMRK